MFYRFLKKSELTESTSRQYAKTYPKHAVVLSNVNEVSKKNSLFEIIDLPQVQTIYNIVKDTEENRKAKNAFSAMLHKYEEFLESLTASESETQTDSPKQTARTNQPGI